MLIIESTYVNSPCCEMVSELRDCGEGDSMKKGDKKRKKQKRR
jgi:hypothetical protein